MNEDVPGRGATEGIYIVWGLYKRVVQILVSLNYVTKENSGILFIGISKSYRVVIEFIAPFLFYVVRNICIGNKNDPQVLE